MQSINAQNRSYKLHYVFLYDLCFSYQKAAEDMSTCMQSCFFSRYIYIVFLLFNIRPLEIVSKGFLLRALVLGTGKMEEVTRALE